MDVGLELLKENTPESMHNIIDGAAMIVSPVKSVKQIVDGISDGLGIVAKKGDVVSDGLKKIDGNVPEANSNGNTLLESGRCSGVFCNGEQVPDVGQDVDVEFSFTRNQSRHDADEFIDQGFDQGAGLSNRTSGEALDTIDDFDLNGRPPEASTAIRNFRDENPDLDLSGQDVLHRTDVCVGGDPSCISGGGASGINRSLGVQNNNQRDSIREQLESISSDTNPTVRVIIENNAGD
jgi:hypothetical protein